VTVNVASAPTVTVVLEGFCVICGAVAVTPGGVVSVLAPPPPHAHSVRAASKDDRTSVSLDLRGTPATSRVL
jgi:hypothetical protein